MALACLVVLLVLMGASDLVDEDNHGLATALTAGGSIGVLLLFWPPAPWWVGVLVLLLSGVVLLVLSYLVQELVGAVVRRDPWVAWLGTEVGLFNAVLCVTAWPRVVRPGRQGDH